MAKSNNVRCKVDDNRIQINEVKGVKFVISDNCKNWEEANLGKDRYKRECGEGNEGTEYEDTTKDFKSRRRG